MTNKNKWIDISVLNLFIVGLLGILLRSKIVFALPFINYNHLLEGHSHFTLGGWATLVIMVMMVYELLPAASNKKIVYQWLLGGIVLGAWGMLIAFILEGYGIISIIFSTFFIFLTYIFSLVFIMDILKAKPGRSVLLLAISSTVCLILSSAGPFIITYIYFTKSFGAFLYRDALFTYLHFQYNGFFSLAIFALLFNHLSKNMTAKTQKIMYRFAVVLCISIIPSLFLSYLWQDPNQFFRIIAVAGSLLLLLTCFLFILSASSMLANYREEKQVIRFLVFVSMSAFLLKLFLQCFTIFPGIGNAIFGNRPIIMGFLHLVFLGFVSLFILAFFAKTNLLDSAKASTKIALIAFAASVIFNEAILIAQGLATMFMPGSTLFPWLLWVAGICLFMATILIAIARIQTKKLK
jgi:hypothetical protein